MKISIYCALIGLLLHAKHCAGAFATSISFVITPAMEE